MANKVGKYKNIWRVDKNTNERLQKYETIRDAVDWLRKENNVETNIRSMCQNISYAINKIKFKSYFGFKWELDLDNLPDEEWREVYHKHINNTKGIYVSTKGRVRKDNGITTGTVRKDKYLEVQYDGYNYLVHRLVAFAFLPNFYGKSQINHKDGNRQNNRLYNLEWTTNRENGIHAYEMGLNPNQKKVNQYTRDGEFIKEYRSCRLAGRETSIHYNSIQSCCKGLYSHAGGFLWRYE